VISDTPDLDARLRRLLASDPSAMAHAPQVWQQLRQIPEPHAFENALLVTRFEDAKRVLRDTEFFGYVHVGQGRSADEITAGYTSEQVEAFHEVAAFERNYMNRSGDGDTHARLRRIAQRAFTPRRVEEMRNRVVQAANDLLDEADGDLAPFAFMLPLQLICDMLGVPVSDRDLVHSWSGRLGRNRGGVEPEPLVDARDAMREFRGYVEAMLDDRRSGRSSVPPLVEDLVGAEHDERLSATELTAMFVLLLFAGHETTTNLLGIGLVELLSSRSQWQLLCVEPGVVHRATEELLRFVTPVQFLGRTALKETSLGLTPVPAGQYVMPILAAANRDPDVFAEPDRLDLLRDNAKEHLSLGFGIHFCLGASLARLEGQAAFSTLAHRFPDLELAGDPANFPFIGHAMLRRLGSIPVSLGRDRGRSA
jgi:cytochrome P450